MIESRDLARAIKELRGRRTQRVVAKRAGIDPATWNAYEKGSRKPRRGLEIDVIALQNAMALGFSP